MSKIKILLLSLFIFGISAGYAFADIDPEHRKQQEADELQRRVEGFYDIQFNKISNMEFTATNTGITFYNQKTGKGTGIWPRGSINCYIFGGGIWVGSNKRNYIKDAAGEYIWKIDTVYKQTKWDRDNPIIQGKDTIGFKTKTVFDTIKVREVDTTKASKLVAVSYNPNSAKSVMVPGRIEEGDAPIPTETQKYRVYFSLDYNPSDGAPLVEESGPVWPIWDDSRDSNDVLKYDRYFGHYINDVKKRNTADYPRGPAFISGEDIFCTYKDTDLTRYGDFGGVGTLAMKGYPQRIQYEQMIYSWGFGDYRDFVFIKYDQINMNTDTLWDMWLAPVYDVDITLSLNYHQGAGNDVTCFYGKEGSKGHDTPPDSNKAKKNMAYQYSLGNMGESGRGFGYVGFVFLESPAIIKQTLDIVEYAGKKDTLRYPTDSMGFVRRDVRTIYDSLAGKYKKVRWYPVPEQLGLVTFRNWPISEDKKRDEEMYKFFSSGWKDGPAEPGDMRYMMATGPFHLRPKDTARTVVGLVIAGTGKGGDADGTDEDLTELVRKVDFMQKVYDENFRAPQPPARAVITEWTPLNNGMMIQWDSTSEQSVDAYEKGLSFMGYKIYRARRLNLDTFDVNNVTGNTMYPSGKGPYGWKELRSYDLPTPYLKSNQSSKGYSTRMVGYGPRAQVFSGIDSMMVVGPKYVTKDSIDRNAIVVMKIPRGVNMYSPSVLQYAINRPENPFNKLKEGGFYDDKVYGNKISAVINSIDTFSTWNPWGKFYAKKAKEDGLDFNKSAYCYNPDKKENFLVDSVMLCTLELNPSLAKINPLFYKKLRIKIDTATLNAFYRVDKDDTTKRAKSPEVWVIKDSTVNDSVKVKFRVKIDTLYLLGTEEITQVTGGGSPIITMSVMVEREQELWLKSLEHYNMVMDSVYSYVSKGWIKNYHVANFTPAAMYKTGFAASDIAKKEVIMPYMKRITNNRTFIDIGDDPEPGSDFGNAYIYENEDVTKTERLFNNVEYYYKVVSYDEGDFGQPTPTKINEGLEGLPNLAKTYPSAERAGGKLNFQVISQDTDKLGGLYNFNLFAIDEQRASQLFAGDTLEVEFSPTAYSAEIPIISKDAKDSSVSKPTYIGFYGTNVKVTNLTKKQLLYDDDTRLEVTPCSEASATTYVDYTAYRTGSDTLIIEPKLDPTKEADTVKLGLVDSREQYPVAVSHFTTGDFKARSFCYAFGSRLAETQYRDFSPMFGNIGISFDAAIKQFGGMYRGDSVDMMKTNVTTSVVPLPINEFWRKDTTNFKPLTCMPVAGELNYYGGADATDTTAGGYVYESFGSNPTFARFNNGPGIYEVEFMPGGEEEITAFCAKNNNQPKKFKAKYLIPVIKDSFSYKRAAPERTDVDSVEIKYHPDIPHMELPVQADLYPIRINGFSYQRIVTPSPLMLPTINKNADEFYRKFNLYAQGYINCRYSVGSTAGEKSFAKDANLREKYDNEVWYLGTQGRYYLTAYSDDGDTLDFVHTFNIAGAQFIAAYLQKGRKADGVRDLWAKYKNEPKDKEYGADFAAGDKIKLMTWGGVSGFPEKGAKVRFAVSNPHLEPITDDILDQIKVVPNPYVISHQGQKSAYDAKLYFTKLPKECTINIYTASGDLVTTIEHKENVDDITKGGVDIFDLLTKNGQRIQSQTLVALIKTPNGAMITKQFSIIVGGFRIVD